MEMVCNLIPRFLTSALVSVTLPVEEYRDGIDIPTTFSFPNASTAIVATIAESTPPERPITTFSKPFL